MNTTTLELPNGVITDDSVIRDIEIRKLDGNDEDFLRNKKELRQGNTLERLLKRVIMRVGEHDTSTKIDKVFDNCFLLADINFVLVRLRQFTIGDIYSFEIPCPSCERLAKHMIDLSKFEVDEQNEKYRGKRVISMDVDLRIVGGSDDLETMGEGVQATWAEDNKGIAKLSGDLASVTFRPLFINDLKMLDAIKLQYGAEKGSRELMLQIASICGRKPGVHDFKAMGWRERNALRRAMDLAVGGLDVETVFECSRCDRETKDNLPLDVASFFFPTADMQKNAKVAIPYRNYGGTSVSLDTTTNGSLAK